MDPGVTLYSSMNCMMMALQIKRRLALLKFSFYMSSSNFKSQDSSSIKTETHVSKGQPYVHPALVGTMQVYS